LVYADTCANSTFSRPPLYLSPRRQNFFRAHHHTRILDVISLVLSFTERRVVLRGERRERQWDGGVLQRKIHPRNHSRNHWKLERIQKNVQLRVLVGRHATWPRRLCGVL
ncbi:hypothetical protein OESDEN_17780, partial [Oesophagostomum dentatum]